MEKMCRLKFRIKLNLSKFYNDVRSLSWIFVDSSKMIRIAHIKEHITALFNIKEPFHLLLKNTVYLPPNEDIRILKEDDETILVCPGSGMENVSNIPTIIAIPLDSVHNSAKVGQLEVSVEHNQLQPNVPSATLTPIQEIVLSQKVNKSPNDSSDMLIVPNEAQDSDAGNITESKSIDTNITDDFNIADNFLQCPKRKRVRHRKKKLQTQLTQITQEEQCKSKKPKILNSCVIAPSKHIRFDNLDTEEFEENQVVRPEAMNGSTTNKVSPSRELANLLSLGQSSTPLTFTNPKVKMEFKRDRLPDDEMQLDVPPKSTNESIDVSKKFEEGKNILTKDFQADPIMTVKPQLKDIIAFKMLKIGSDYTPQVSDFIVGEVVSCCSETSVYTFRVLQGLSEVQVPVGKFTILEAEGERVMNDTITLNYPQIMEPRLIKMSSR